MLNISLKNERHPLLRNFRDDKVWSCGAKCCFHGVEGCSFLLEDICAGVGVGAGAAGGFA